MTHNEFEVQYWTYYIFLENSFLHATRYVYLSKKNFSCYSYEFDSMLLTVATEVENVIKTIYREVIKSNNGEKKKKSITEWYNLVKNKIFTNFEYGELPEVSIRGRKLHFSPFKGFGVNTTWWSHYNSIKHDRYLNLTKANMENVLNALAALYCLESLFAMFLASYQPDTYDALLPLSKLFYNKNFKFKYCFEPIATYDEIDKYGNTTHVLE